MNTHFIGIGGIGMSGLARLLLLKKETVSGSDQATSALTEELESLGAKVAIGHDPKNLPPSGRIVVSSGIRKNNPELYACQTPTHTVIHRSDLLAMLMQDQKALLVAGTHGKTTTSSLLATILMESGLEPSWAVGGIISRYQTNAMWGKGAYFVAEADESDGTHLKYNPYGLIVTNLNEDHLDHYGSKEALLNSFKTFFTKVLSPSHFFWCGECNNLKALAPNGTSYGFGAKYNLNILAFRQEGRTSFFNIAFEGKVYNEIEIPLMGRHNVLNAAAVFGLALRLGLSDDQIRKGLALATGSKRRGELKSEAGGRIILDDYGHHPAEIAATLAGIRVAYPDRRLIVAFQPHRYTRTKDCFREFAPAFKEADVLLVTDIYAAGESPIDGITSIDLLTTMKKGHYVPRGEMTSYLEKLIRPFDVVLTIGAGDITKVSDELAKLAPRKLRVACIYGGRSGEHEVTLLSARNITEAFDKELLDVECFAVNKEGGWISGKKARDYLEKPLPFSGNKLPIEVIEALNQCDVAFPVFHGPYGEDGTVQGLFEMFNLPYAGCSVESSSVAMNKALTKKICAWAGIPVVDFVDFNAYQWTSDQESLLKSIQRLTYPLFVKPVHLGSTLGVIKVHDETELIKAIEYGFTLDHHMIVEQGVIAREIECAIFGSGPWFVSLPGEIFANGSIYDYENKYGQNATQTTAEANLDLEMQKEAQALALAAYQAIGCDGMARVDLFLTHDKKFFLNEINTIPGCTKNSLFPKMCAHSGVSFKEVLNRLLQQAIVRKLKQDR